LRRIREVPCKPSNDDSDDDDGDYDEGNNNGNDDTNDDVLDDMVMCNLLAIRIQSKYWSQNYGVVNVMIDDKDSNYDDAYD
jgi:hypothetical protein